MDRRTLAKALAVSRIVYGVNYLVTPGLSAGTAWLGPAAALPAAKVVARGFGARDVALGAGALLALRRGEDARDWFAAQLIAELADLGATLAAGDDLPKLPRTIALSAAGASALLAAVWLAVAEPQDADCGAQTLGDALAPAPYSAGAPAAAAGPPAEPARGV